MRLPGDIVLLERTPYNRQDPGTGIFLASHGHVVVLQDTRGRYASEGEFYPFRYESQEGYDTVEWAAALDYSDGKVGMFGGSYVGATQILAASAAPPQLVAIFLYVTASEYYGGWTYQSGALMQWFASSWTTGLAEDTLRRKADALAQRAKWVQQLPIENYKLLACSWAPGLVPKHPRKQRSATSLSRRARSSTCPGLFSTGPTMPLKARRTRMRQGRL